MAETKPQTQEPKTEEPKTEEPKTEEPKDQSEETAEIDEEQEHIDEQHDFVGEYQPRDQLDSHLAVVEEQFRKGFEERFSTQKARKQWEDETEMIRSSKVFREVSRYLGYEWKPIFADLMKKFPPDVVEKERLEIEKQQPIIQGYKALTTWKELTGPSYTIMQLVDVLREHNMDDIADEVLNILDSADLEQKDDKDKPKTDDKGKSTKLQRKKSDVANKPKQGILDNRRLLLLAKKVGEDWEPLGKALEVHEEELAEIREGEDSKTYQGAFKVLWSWRQTQPPAETEESRNILKAALEKVGKKNLLEDLEK